MRRLSFDLKTDLPWQVIVWNDPVNLMDYVAFVLRKLFGHSPRRPQS
jgi:ATP-dependent Clp protease adaptor protein ClpS